MSKEELLPCPICGAKAFVKHDIVDGFDFGYSVGCPRACIADGIHGFNTSETFRQARLTFFNLRSREEAIEVWNKRVKEQENERGRDI